MIHVLLRHVYFSSYEYECRSSLTPKLDKVPEFHASLKIQSFDSVTPRILFTNIIKLSHLVCFSSVRCLQHHKTVIGCQTSVTDNINLITKVNSRGTLSSYNPLII